MTTALFAFEAKYARDYAARSVPSIDWLEVKAIVSTAIEVMVFLESHSIDLVVVGPALVEDVGEVLKMKDVRPAPLVVALGFGRAAVATHQPLPSAIDELISVANGLTSMMEELKAHVIHRTERCQSVGIQSPDVPVTRIQVADQADREIVRLVAAGLPDRDIADVVHYSNQAVRNRISRILGDTGARNRTHLACMYLTLVHEGVNPFDPN